MVPEKPDTIGFDTYGNSILIECKTSRADFLVDKQKPHRKEGGMGDKRFFMAPKGLLDPTEIPDGWGLIEYSKSTVRVVKKSADFAGNKSAEMMLMVSALAFEQKILDKVVTDYLKEEPK